MLAPLNRIQRHAFLYQFPQGTQLSQEIHPLLNRLQHIVDLALCSKPADTESDAAVRTFIAVT